MENLKLKLRYSQRDYRWERKEIGASGLTIGGNGCLGSCIGMLTGIYPDVLFPMLDITDRNYKYGPGLILWNKYNIEALKKLGLEFVGRYRKFDSSDVTSMQLYCMSPDHYPILEVETRTGRRHWVLPFGRALTYRGLGWACNDPWSGRVEWKTVGMFAPYVKETGWLLFKRCEKK